MNDHTLLEDNIENYLQKHERKDMLRFITCGSVDDGKSTLIGRLLYDSKLIFDDHMASIKKDSQKFNTTNGEFDLALLVDGLQSEREQGITIDVAYRFFTSEKRKFIIADCPGHEQYTRNMVTGASNCDLAIVLIDARFGVQTQTKRHSYIVSLLGINHVIVVINKMDLIDYNQEEYRKIKSEYKKFAQQLNIKDIRFVPISALNGDNVVNKSAAMDWYPGAPLMELLNSVTINENENNDIFRFPVQYVTRHNLDFRGFCGTISSGAINVGDMITVMPSGKSTIVKEIVTADGNLLRAVSSQAITITTNDEIDISRGDIIVKSNQLATASNQFIATVVWMDEAALQPDKEYEFKIGTKKTYGKISQINYKVDINTLQKIDVNELHLNEIASCNITTSNTLVIDEYKQIRATGSFIMIDRLTNMTVGAGMITCCQFTKSDDKTVNDKIHTKAEVELNAFIRKNYPEWGCIKI